jgi:transcriptional regulatory protein LevR
MGGNLSFNHRFDILLESKLTSPESIHITNEVIGRIESHYQIKLDEENGASLVTHLAVTIKKLLSSEYLNEIPEICKTEALTFIEEHEFAMELSRFIQNFYQIDFNQSEVAFLTIHLKNITQHFDRKEGKKEQ